MVPTKNFETVSIFVEVMQRKLLPLFSWHGIYSRARLLLSDAKMHRVVLPAIGRHLVHFTTAVFSAKIVDNFHHYCYFQSVIVNLIVAINN